MMKSKKMRELEDRVSVLEMARVDNDLKLTSFYMQQKENIGINESHIEIFEGMEKNLSWLNGAVTLLSFATAGLLVALAGSYAKLVKLKNMMNEG